MAQSQSHTPLMAAARAIVTDPELQQFLNDWLDEPDERVGRKGVPDHKMRFREPRSGKTIWKERKQDIIDRGKLIRRIDKFDYSKLKLSERIDQVRLLRVHPAKQNDDAIICDLRVMNLTAVVNKFEALSYCWGTEQPDSSIWIRSLLSTETAGHYEVLQQEEFPVRTNLLLALRQLRKSDRYVLLWVDAICIDQRSTPEATAEKNRQLSMMSSIYNSAKNVCIWLGHSDDKTGAAFKLVNMITNFQMLEKHLHPVEEATRTCEAWCNLVKILKKTPWFSRRWIIQEIASARNASVHCGDDVVHWDDLAVAISLLREHCDKLERQFGKPLFAEVPALCATQLVKALTKVCRKDPSTGEITERLLNFETLVCTFQQFQARFPQDVIHSVRALAGDAPGADDADLGADKEKSTRDLFIAFVKRCIRQSGSLDILCRHWAPPILDSAGKQIPVPTWISMLSNGPFGLPGESFERQNGENFVAISPGYEWKRYNASNYWSPPAMKKATLHPRTSPEHSQTTVHARDPNNRCSIGEIREPDPSHVVSDAPTSDQFSFPTPVEDDMQGISEENHIPRAAEPFQPDRPPEPLQIFAMPHATKSLEERTIETWSRKPSKTHKYDSGNDAQDTDSFENPSNASSHMHQPSTTLPSIQGVLAKSTRTHKRLSSRAVQEKWKQEDEEHREHFSGQLHVHGFTLGIVQDCSDVMRNGIVPGDWLKRLAGPSVSNNVVPDELWRTLVADRTADGGDPPEWYKRACLHCLKDSRLMNSNGDLDSNRSLPNDKVDSSTLTYLKRVKSVIWRRRIIQLEMEVPGISRPNVRIGLAPEQTAKGDVVCILAGCSVPVVMRKSSDAAPPESLGVFELIGEAYVHGMMDGEAVPDIEMANKSRKIFTLQ